MSWRQRPGKRLSVRQTGTHLFQGSRCSVRAEAKPQKDQASYGHHTRCTADSRLESQPDIPRIRNYCRASEYGFCFADQIMRDLHLKIASQWNGTYSSHGKDQLPGPNRRNTYSSAWGARHMQEITSQASWVGLSVMASRRPNMKGLDNP